MRVFSPRVRRLAQVENLLIYSFSFKQKSRFDGHHARVENPRYKYAPGTRYCCT